MLSSSSRRSRRSMRVREMVEEVKPWIACSSTLTKIVAFLLFLVSFLTMTALIMLDFETWTVVTYGVFLVVTFLLCCICGSWMSSIEHPSESKVEIRKGMNFVISTVLPVSEHGNIAQIYSDLDLPVHVHKMDDMQSDFCPILYDSMDRSSSSSLRLIRDHSACADSIIAASQMRARLSFNGSVLSNSTSTSSLQTTSSNESTSDLPMYFRAHPSTRLPSVLEEASEHITVLPKLPSYEVAVLISQTNTALPV
ncbi:hypothetical protein QR680_008835 [Steinernema hermaphroditum]|uniref:Transmembrane protein n=1 Tax=Steinernema hermaphroditum TaxID=289476 RepID=A0AA39M8T3_9BILA|nr:hypothetical protein QR680_008835 [Steinernema hermaphroditum]